MFATEKWCYVNKDVFFSVFSYNFNILMKGFDAITANIKDVFVSILKSKRME